MKQNLLVSGLCAALAAGVSLCSAGCGEQATSTSVGGDQAAAPDTCSLLVPAEIAGVVGHAVGDGVDPGSVVPGCQWPRAGESTPFVPVVQITLVPDSARSFDTWLAMMRKEYEESGFDFDDEDYRRVDGLGEWAVYIPDGGLLMAGQRGHMLQVMVSSGPDDSRHLALARLALERLP